MKIPKIKPCCGGAAHESCDCTTESPFTRAYERCTGRWREVFAEYGIALPAPKKSGPCPVCGGRDRFTFDDKNSKGTWHCRHCDPSAGGGLTLLAKCLEKSEHDTALELANGYSSSTAIAAPRFDYAAEEAATLERQARLAVEAVAMIASATKGEHKYLQKKGLVAEGLLNSDPVFGSDHVVQPGELLLVPVYKNGEIINVQKITESGVKRPLSGGYFGSGIYHKIAGADDKVCVCEGYATALTLAKLTKRATYAAFSAQNLAGALEHAIKEHPNADFIICADRDESKAGEKGALKAQALFSAAKVVMPPEPGDWDDMRQKYGDKKTIEMLKSEMGVETVPKPVPKPKPVPPPANPFGIDKIDIDSPPGLAGDIVDYMREGAHRDIKGGAFAALAMQTMSMSGSYTTGHSSTKLSLVTITLGVSASGKDRAPAVAKELLGECSINIYGDIRTDKDLIRAAAWDDGRCFYIKDEAHTLLSESLKGGNSMTAKIPAVLMELATTNRFTLSKLHSDEFIDVLETQKFRAEKKIVAFEDIRITLNPTKDEGKIKKLESDIKAKQDLLVRLEATERSLRGGIENPALNLVAISTPQKMAEIITEDSIESGFLGRALIFDCGSHREDDKGFNGDADEDFDTWLSKSKERAKEEEAKRLRLKKLRHKALHGIQMIVKRSEDAKNGSAFDADCSQVYANDEANHLIYQIGAYYNQEKFRNHERLGALYARIRERITSVSSILALDNIVDNKMTIEPIHVRYALKCALTSIKHLNDNLVLNEAKDASASRTEQIEGLMKTITRKLEGKEMFLSDLKKSVCRTKTFAAIKFEMRLTDQDPFDIALLKLGRTIKQDGKKISLA